MNRSRHYRHLGNRAFAGLMGLRGDSDVYEPSGEEQLVLKFMGLQLAYDTAAKYMKDVTDGVISRTTGIKVIDVGDFEIQGSNVVATSCILVIKPMDGNFIFFIGRPVHPDYGSTEYISSKRAYYAYFFASSADYGLGLYNKTKSLVSMLTNDYLNRPAQNYEQQAVSNDNSIAIEKRIEASNAALKQQIIDDQKAFKKDAQIQANVIEAQRQKEVADEKIRQVSDELARITRMKEEADNYADSTYEAQRLEQERQRQINQAGEAQRFIDIGIQQGAQLAKQEAVQQTVYNREAELAKLKQTSTNTATGAQLSKTTQTNAVSNYAALKPAPLTTSKPAVATTKPTTTTGKPTTTAGAGGRIEKDEEVVVDKDGNPVDKKGLPTWAWVAIGLTGVVVVGGTVYHGNKKGWFKGKKEKVKKSKSKR